MLHQLLIYQRINIFFERGEIKSRVFILQTCIINKINVKIMNLVLNIGLNNNPKEVDFIIELLKVWFGAEKLNTKTVNSVYNDNIEPTLIYSVNTNIDITLSISLIESLCKLCTQECIAMIHGNYKMLVYNPNFKGEIMDFIDEYFVNI